MYGIDSGNGYIYGEDEVAESTGESLEETSKPSADKSESSGAFSDNI